MVMYDLRKTIEIHVEIYYVAEARVPSRQTGHDNDWQQGTRCSLVRLS